MEQVLMFILKNCPYCRQALNWMEELKNENPEYASIDVKLIDEEEQAEVAGQYDYYYVPSYYINGVKVHEGSASKDIVRDVFERASKQGL